MNNQHMLTHFHESNLIEGFNLEKYDDALDMAWDYLIRFDKLTKTVICQAHLITTIYQTDLFPTHRGFIRPINVKVGGRLCPSPKEAKLMLVEWLLDINTYDQFPILLPEKYSPKEMHIKFEHIHPFVDGNGRVGRLLMWWHEKMLGKEPTLIKFHERKEYYEWFKEEKIPKFKPEYSSTVRCSSFIRKKNEK